jgi:hypothetical protein
VPVYQMELLRMRKWNRSMRMGMDWIASREVTEGGTGTGLSGGGRSKRGMYAEVTQKIPFSVGVSQSFSAR